MESCWYISQFKSITFEISFLLTSNLFSDINRDDALNRTEFRAFLHPEDHPAMKDVIVVETMEDIDKDKVKKCFLCI